jgi:ribosomal-protein-alanine N-acetyltransferase
MILETERLVIRKFKSADLAGLTDMFTDAEVMKYIGPRRAMTEVESQAWLMNILQRQDTELTRYAVALKEMDELIGVAGLKEEDEVMDFGYYLRRKYWGNGYASEACSAIQGYIETSLQIKDYQIFIADENTRSIRMIERLGLKAVSDEQGYLYQRANR